MKPPVSSTLVNKNVVVAGHRTSIRLEPAMWEKLQEIGVREKKNRSEVVTVIDRQRKESSLTSAIRVYLLMYYVAASSESGHRAVGHGQLPAN